MSFKNSHGFDSVSLVIPIRTPNIKVLAQILLEISCSRDFHVMFSKDKTQIVYRSKDNKLKVCVSILSLQLKLAARAT